MLLVIALCVFFTVTPADCVRTGAGRCSQETEAGLQAGAGGGLHESGELRTALPRVHWEETPSETELCLSEDLSPSFFIMWLPPSAFQRWILPLTFFLLPVFVVVVFFFPFTLLHRLVYLKLCEGWPGAEVGVSHSAMWGIPQLHHREASRGDCLKAGHIGNVSIPPVGRKEGKNIFMLPSRIYTDR